MMVRDWGHYEFLLPVSLEYMGTIFLLLLSLTEDLDLTRQLTQLGLACRFSGYCPSVLVPKHTQKHV